MKTNDNKCQAVNDQVTDPAIKAYDEIEKALDAKGAQATTPSQVTHAYYELAQSEPITMAGAFRKIEMNGRWVNILESCDWELSSSAAMAEFLELLRLNNKTLVRGLAEMLA